MEPIVVRHSNSGAEATIHPFGATVISYKTSSNHEVFFVSDLAKKDGSKAIRGGIPLVFPQFGRPDKAMPQHGFLRNNQWTLSEAPTDDDDGASCRLVLKLSDVKNGRGEEGMWSADACAASKLDCQATLTVYVTPHFFSTVLNITNTGNETFDYQTLFHTYYRIYGSKALDQNLCNVTGLEGYSAEDKITGERYVIKNDDDAIFVDREVDRIYHPPANKEQLKVMIKTGEGGSSVEMKAFAKLIGRLGLSRQISTVGAESNDVPVSVVVWNPYIEKSKGMGDFGDEDYHDMLCVEPGVLVDGMKLERGEAVEFTQIITPSV